MNQDPSGHWNLFKAIKDGAKEVYNGVKETVKKVGTAVVEKTTEVFNSAKTFVSNTVDKAKDALQNIGCKASAFLDPTTRSAAAKQVVKDVKNWYNENKAEIWTFVGAGVALVGGLALSAKPGVGPALSGMVVGASLDVMGQIASGTKAGDINWGSVAVSAVSGLVTGGVGSVASGMSKAGAIAVKTVSGAITGGGSNLANQLISNGGDFSSVNWTSVAISTGGGAASGSISGAQARTPDCRIDKALMAADLGVNFTESTAQGLANGQSLSESLKGGVVATAQGFATDQIMTRISPDFTKKTCFVEGTPILTAFGLVAIEKIQAGDMVIATNPETGETAEKEVVRTFENETSELLHVFVNGEEIVTTPEHPFYVPEKGWTSAIKLRAGDQLRLVNGELVTVEKVQHEILENPVKVFNFEVYDFHTYYVGEQSVLVHNKCGESSVDGDSSSSKKLTPREIGAIGENDLKATYGGESQVRLKTSNGLRVVDTLVDGEEGAKAHESKVGRVSNSKKIRMQVDKDAELIRDGVITESTWHFYTSPVTGKGGPTPSLKQNLISKGINIQIH